MLYRRGALLGAIGSTIAARSSAAPPQKSPVDLANYRLTFAAEFNDPAAPLSVRDHGPFTTRFEQWGGLRTLPGTGELELYVDPAFVPSPAGTDKVGHADAPQGEAPPLGYNPFTIREGCLEIAAIPVPPAQRARVDRPYLSGLISTEWTFRQRYGYFEMRAQLPPGRGLWPAFWMVAFTSTEHIEIDIFESIGVASQLYQSTHVATSRGTSTHVLAATPRDFNSTAAMHRYALAWSEQELLFMVDDVVTARADGAPFKDVPPMYLIACMAVGGTWPGTPPASTHFPAVMKIDYIRAYAAR